MKEKKLIKIAIILVLILFLLALNTPSKIIKKTDKFMYTKAICSEEICRDYEIECDQNQITKLSPTGFAIRNYNHEVTNLTGNFC